MKLLETSFETGSLKNKADNLIATNTDTELVDTGIGTGAKFDGKTSILDYGSDFIGTKAITCYGWININNLKDTSVFLMSNGSFIILTVVSGVYRIYSRLGVFVQSNPDTLVFNKPQFIAITRKSDGKASIYIGDMNTEPKLESVEDGDSGVPTAGTSNVLFGNNNLTNVVVNKFVVEEGILTLDEIKEEYSKSLFMMKILNQANENFALNKPTDLSNEKNIVAGYNFISDNNQISDISGNGNDGIVSKGIRTKKGINLKGDGYISCGTGGNAPSNKITIAARFMFRNLGANEYIVVKTDDVVSLDDKFSYRLLKTTGNVINFAISPNGIFNSRIDIDSIDIIEENIFNTVVCTYDGSIMKIYINGILSIQGSRNGNIFQGLGELVLGARRDSTDSNYKLGLNGILEDSRIIDGAWTEKEVKNYHNSFAKRAVLNETFLYGKADGVIRTPKGWKKGTGSFKIVENSFGKSLECTSNGNISKLYQGELNVDASINFNGTVYKDLLSNLISTHSWLSLVGENLTFTLTTGQYFTDINIKEGIEV